MQFPKLRALARQLFAIPASSAASERSFSAAGCTVSARRTALSSENVDDILFIHSNSLMIIFVTVRVIAQLYAILAIYDVLIVNNLFPSVKCVATPSNVNDQPMLIGKLGITI